MDDDHSSCFIFHFLLFTFLSIPRCNLSLPFSLNICPVQVKHIAAKKGDSLTERRLLIILSVLFLTTSREERSDFHISSTYFQTLTEQRLVANPGLNFSIVVIILAVRGSTDFLRMNRGGNDLLVFTTKRALPF